MPISKDECIENRRIEDARFTRMENKINDLHSKVNNGLSSRSVETVPRVSSIEGQLQTHIIEATELSAEVESIAKSVKGLTKMQQLWVTLFYRGLSLIAVSLIGFILWIFVNIHAIDSVIDHMKLHMDQPLPYEVSEHKNH